VTSLLAEESMGTLPLVALSVSVVIPTRDRPELMRRAVVSVLDQDYDGPIEVVVVQDRPGPDVLEPTFSIDRPDRSVRLMVNKDAPGAAATRNIGLRAATSDLVALCDDDDVWLPGKLAAQVTALEESPAAIGCGTGYVLVQGEQRVDRIPDDPEITHQALLRSRVADVHPSSLIFHRELLVDQVGLLDEQIPGSYGEDYDWLLRATTVGPVLALATPYVEVLWHPGSYFMGRWQVIAEAINYLLAKHPDFRTEPQGLARLYGRLAFAYASLGDRAAARHWALRTLRVSPKEKRGYLALAAGFRLLPPATAAKLANARGRGI
jgi:glycosyltransferase involved in cell wall biosynthesis